MPLACHQLLADHAHGWQVDVYTPYPHYRPRLKIQNVQATSRASASASKSTAPDAFQLEAAANVEILQSLPSGAADQILSFQIAQLMASFSAKLSAGA